MTKRLRTLNDQAIESFVDPLELPTSTRLTLGKKTGKSSESPSRIPQTEELKVEQQRQKSPEKVTPVYLAVEQIKQQAKNLVDVPKIKELSPLKIKCSDFKAQGALPTPTIPRQASPRKFSPRKAGQKQTVVSF